MLRLRYSHRLEELVRMAVDDQAREVPADPFASVEMCVTGANLDARLRFELARRLGVSFGYRVRSVEAELSSRLDAAGHEVADRSRTAQALLTSFGDGEVLRAPVLAPVRRYLESGPGGDSRRFQLADELAGLFSDYDRSRPSLLRAWERGDDGAGVHSERERWQRALWRRVVVDGKLVPLALGVARHARDLPTTPLFVVGPSYLPRGLGEALARLSEHAPVTVYALRPTQEYWEDMTSIEEERQGRRRSRAVPVTDVPLALRLWGRPLRDTDRLLGEAAGFDFEGAFEPPEGRDPTCLLARFQGDITTLAAGPGEARDTGAAAVGDDGSDDSVRIHACPSRERELEIIASDIRDQLARHPDLRCTDVVLYVAGDFELATAQLASVFHRAGNIPHHLSGLSLAADSRLVEAFEALVQLPLGSFSRPELLRLMIHPAIIRRFPGARPATWVGLAEDLGIVRGADAGDHRSTYIDGDLYNWGQGARRIALGAVMSEVGDPRPIDAGGYRYRPLSVPTDAIEQAAQFALLSRSLIADARHARDLVLPLTEWARWFESLAHAYLHAAAPADERAFARLQSVFEDMARIDDGSPLSYKLAAATVRRQLAGLTSSRGELGADGVTVAPLELGHVVSARVVYVAGLSGDALPDSGRRSPLDVRTGSVGGDVEPRERVRVAFLEAVLGARSALRLSYVDRDPGSGDQRAPSALIAEMHSCLRRYVDPAAVTIRHPLRAWDEDDASASPLLAVQRRAAAARTRTRVLHALGTVPARSALLAALGDPRLAGARSALRLGHERDLPGGAGRDDVIELPLTVLRRFLETPVQAWAGFVLGIGDKDEPVDLERQDEPLGIDALRKTTIVREVFIRALRAGDDAQALRRRIHERVQSERLSGTFPTGLFADRIEAELIQSIEPWLAHVGGEPRVLSFGRARESAEVDELLAPIEVSLPSGRRAHLVGVTQPFVDGHGSLILSVSPRRRLKHTVRGWFEHVVLAAAEHPAAGGFVLLRAGREPEPHPLAPMDPGDARAYLGAMVADLVGERHDYALPCELAVPLARSGDMDEARRAARGDKPTSDEFGPVARVSQLRVPTRAAELAGRRFGPLLALEDGS